MVSRTSQIAMLGGYTAVLAAWIAWVGVPTDSVQIFLWIWLATVAWNYQAPWRSHLAFVRDWWPPLALLMVYLYSRGLADELGLGGVHITEPIAFDRWIGGGTLPTEALQAQLCGDPCTRALPPAWYDVVLTGVYFSHFVTALIVAGVLWVRSRAAWVHFMRRYLSLSILGLVCYIAYPMAPPWLAAEEGYLTSDITRITGRGWSELGMGGFHLVVAGVGNPVAAMPSLHTAIATLVALYGVLRLRSRWRWLLLAYPLAMSFMLVYYAEHYVLDILAGYVAAGVVLWGCSAWERRFTRAGTIAETRLEPASVAGTAWAPSTTGMVASTQATGPDLAVHTDSTTCDDHLGGARR